MRAKRLDVAPAQGLQPRAHRVLLPPALIVAGELLRRRLPHVVALGPATGTPPPLVNVGGTLVRIGASADVNAFILAPDARLKLGRSVTLQGTFCADRLFSDNRLNLTCPPPP